MEVQIISNTVQKFNGESYYLCGNYFQRKGKRLHREVWRYHNGDIPNGYHIHHIDANKHHNDISNLSLTIGKEHIRQHMSNPKRVKQSMKTIEIARESARKWHGSAEGLAYHSALGKENYKKRTLHTYTCDFCGKEFQTKHIYGNGQNHFCHPNCKAKHRTRRLRNENKAH